MIDIPDINPCEPHNNNTASTYSDTQISDVFLYDENSIGFSFGIGEILCSYTYVADHVVSLNSQDWTNTGI